MISELPFQSVSVEEWNAKSQEDRRVLLCKLSDHFLSRTSELERRQSVYLEQFFRASFLARLARFYMLLITLLIGAANLLKDSPIMLGVTSEVLSLATGLLALFSTFVIGLEELFGFWKRRDQLGGIERRFRAMLQLARTNWALHVTAHGESIVAFENASRLLTSFEVEYAALVAQTDPIRVDR